MPVELIDTAGWEADVVGPLELGLAARDDQIQKSQLILWCSASDQSAIEGALDHKMFANAIQSGARVRRVWTKSDSKNATATAPTDSRTSIHDPASVEKLRAVIVDQLSGLEDGGGELLASTGSRCRDCLNAASRSLRRAHELAAGGHDDTLIALELRAALDELGVITGQTYTDDILDRIFSRFCIGK
jgi:tRNA modification GTPase